MIATTHLLSYTFLRMLGHSVNSCCLAQCDISSVVFTIEKCCFFTTAQAMLKDVPIVCFSSGISAACMILNNQRPPWTTQEMLGPANGHFHFHRLVENLPRSSSEAFPSFAAASHPTICIKPPPRHGLDGVYSPLIFTVVRQKLSGPPIFEIFIARVVSRG